MSDTNLFFENLSDEQTIDLNGGSFIAIALAIVGGVITAYGIYETGKSHIYEYNYNKAYDAEKARLTINNAASGGGGGASTSTMYLQTR